MEKCENESSETVQVKDSQFGDPQIFSWSFERFRIVMDV